MHCRKANLPTSSHRNEGMMISSPIIPTPRRASIRLENTRAAVRPIAPFVPRRPNASGHRASLKHPQPHPGWVNHSATALTNTVASSPEAFVPRTVRDTQGSSASFAGTATTDVLDKQQGRRFADSIIERGDTASTMGLGRTNVPLSNTHPQRPVTRKPVSIYISDGCWGCEDTKAVRDKATGLCRKCELYLIPCIDWTPEEMIETPESTSPVHRELRRLSVEREVVESPTLGESAAYVHILGDYKTQNRAPPVNTIPGTSAIGMNEDYVSPPQSHFSDYTSASLSLSGTRIPRVSYDEVVPDEESEEEIQELCKFWHDIETSSRSLEGERLILHPTAKAPGNIKCVLGPPSPERLASKPAVATTGKLAVQGSSLLASRRSQRAAISFQSDNSVAMGSWLDFHSQKGSAQKWLEEPKLNTRASRPASSIYSLYLDL